VAIETSNVDQLNAWNGEQGAYWTEHADRFDAGVANYHARFLDAAGITDGATVLDVGCGSGQTTRDAARRAGSGSALGVDLSGPMLALARRRAERERLANVTFEQADAQVHPFPADRFDVAISRHGVMFFGDPPAAFRNIAGAMRPGGRLVLLTWQPYERNEWVRTFRGILAGGREVPMPPPGAPSPWSLSEPDAIRALLTSTGFTDVRVTGLTEPMYYGRDVEDAYRFVHGLFGAMLNDLDAGTRDRAVDTLRADLAEHQTGDGIHYASAAWLVEAVRTRPAPR
jgi:SAM-dependent methyltransferase